MNSSLTDCRPESVMLTWNCVIMNPTGCQICSQPSAVAGWLEVPAWVNVTLICTVSSRMIYSAISPLGCSQSIASLDELPISIDVTSKSIKALGWAPLSTVSKSRELPIKAGDMLVAISRKHKKSGYWLRMMNVFGALTTCMKVGTPSSSEREWKFRSHNFPQ